MFPSPCRGSGRKGPDAIFQEIADEWSFHPLIGVVGGKPF